MTKLQLLHRALNERLMAAVEQIMEMVGGTVLEYEVETVRARKENEVLKRRLRWLEGEIPTDWPDIEIDSSGLEQPLIVDNTVGFEQPTVVDDTSGIEQSVNDNDEPVQNWSSIKIEPVVVSDLQSLIPEGRLAAAVSIRSADLEIVRPGTTQATNAGISNSLIWASSHSYMAPLDCDPTVVAHQRGISRSRSKKMSFACPDCGKVFGSQQRLVLHMRIHSADTPYTYRRRKACFYGDKTSRKKRPHDLSSLYPSKEFMENVLDIGERTGQATVNNPIGKQKSQEHQKQKSHEHQKQKPQEHQKQKPQVHQKQKPQEHQKQKSQQHQKQKLQEHPKKPVAKNETKVKKAQAASIRLFNCSECDKTFTRASGLRFHFRSHERGRALACKEQTQMPLLNNKPEKNISKVSTQTKENQKMVAKQLRPRASKKKIFKCPQCDKVFSRERWLAPHIQSHMNKTIRQQKKMLIPGRRRRKAIFETKENQTMVAEQLGPHASKKKIFKCPQCDKVFSRERWLAPHIQSHINETIRQQKKMLIPGRRRRKSIFELLKEEELKAEQSNVRKDDTTTASEKQATINLESKSKRKKKKKRRKVKEIAGESTKNPEGSTEDASGIKQPRKTFSCDECGKVYLMEGCLQNHIRGHKAEKLRNKREKEHQKMLRKMIQDIRLKEQKLEKEKKLVETQNSVNVRKTKNQDTGVMLPKEEEIKAEQSNVRNTDSTTVFEQHATSVEPDKIHLKSKSKRKKKKLKRTGGVSTKNPEESSEDAGAIKQPRKTYSCHDCGKVYSMEGWLQNHIRGHKAERLRKEREKEHQKMLKKIIEGVRLKEQKLEEEKNLVEMQNSVNIRKTENQDTGAMLPKEEEIKAEQSNVRNDDSTTASQQQTTIREPYKINFKSKFKKKKKKLKRTKSASREIADESTKNPGGSAEDAGVRLTPQEGSSTEDTYSQSGQDGGKASFPCRFCDKVFQRRMRLSVHMRIHSCEKPYSYQKRKQQMYGDLTRLRVQDSSIKEPAIESSNENGGFAETGSQTVSQDLRSATEPMKSVEPQSVCSDRKFSLLPRQSPGATSSYITNQARTDSKLNIRTSNHISMQNCRIVLKPLIVKSKTSISPGERNLCLVKTETSVLVPKSSSQSNFSAKQRVADTDPVCVTFSDIDSGDDNDWSDVLNSLDAAEISADVKRVDGSPDVHCGPLVNRDERVATSVQGADKDDSSTCMTSALKFADRASLSQHMQIQSSSEHARKSVNFKTSCNRVVNNETKVKQQVVPKQISETLQYASINFPGVSEEGACAIVKEENTSQTSRCHPDIDTTSRSRRGSETPTKSRKSQQQSKERKALYCHFCGKVCRKIELHLKQDHPKEPEVIKALKCGQNSEERKRLLNSLCSSKSSESDKKDAGVNEDLVHCLFCQGSYRRNQFWKHALVCEQKKAKNGSTVSEVANSVCGAKRSPEKWPSKSQKTLDSESKHQVKETSSKTKSVKAHMPKDDTSTEQKSVSSATTVPESEPTDITINSDSKYLFQQDLSNVKGIPTNSETASYPHLTIADPHTGDPSSDTLIADINKTDPESANHSVHISDSSESKVPDLKSGFSPVQDCIPSETLQLQDTNLSIEDMGKNHEDTRNDLNLILLDSDCTTSLKRKLDSQYSDFTLSETKKKHNPSQPIRVDNNISDEADVSQATYTGKDEASGYSTRKS